MQDQASGLRKLMAQAPGLRVLGLFGPDARLTPVAAAHLAFALGRRGVPVWVVDEAGAPHNVATQFGVPPRTSLDQLLREGRGPLDAVQAVAEGVHVVPVSGGIPALAYCQEPRWRLTAEALAAHPQQPDWLMLHAPRGRETDSLALAARDRLLVVAERKSGLTEAYALLKAVQQAHPAERWHTLIVQARSLDSAREAHAALAATARRFLKIELEWGGAVPRDEDLKGAARHVQPVQAQSGATPGHKAFRDLAEAAMAWPAPADACPAEEFWLRMWLFSRLSAEAAMERVQNVQFSRSVG